MASSRDSMTPSMALDERLHATLPGAVHYNFNFPWDVPGKHVAAAQGQQVVDVDGNVYLDFFSKFGANILGHGNREYLAAMAAGIQSQVLAVDHFGEVEADTLETLVRAVPGADQVRLCLSGTDAVQNALRLARAWTGRNSIVRFTGHYHGSADNVLGGALHSRHPAEWEPQPMAGDPRGTAGRAKGAFAGTHLLPWNSTAALEHVLASDPDLAAVILEPVAINGGAIPASPEFFDFLRLQSRRFGFLIIFDEVITGFRLQFGSAQDIAGVSPDIWVFGKALGGGAVPMSCVAARRELMDLYAQRAITHGGTFNGYALGMHAMRAALNILGRPLAYTGPLERARRMASIMSAAAEDAGVPLVVQGHPMAMVLHVSCAPLSQEVEWDAEMRAREGILREALQECGIIVAPPCRLYPSLALEDDDVSLFEKRFPDALARAKDRWPKASTSTPGGRERRGGT